MITNETHISIKLRQADDRILVVCSGSSGEAMHFITESETARLLRHSVLFHTHVDNLIKLDRSGDASTRTRSILRDSLGRYMRRLGERIFKQVFRGSIADLLNIATGQAIRLGSDVQIGFMVASDFANVVPWELACSHDAYLSHSYDVYRHPFILQPARRPHHSKQGLKVSFISSSPKRDILVDEQIEAVLSAIKGLGERADFSECRDANVTRIADEIFAGVDVLHFLAHGVFERAGGISGGYFIVDGEGDAKEDRLPATMLQSFCRSSPMQLVVLNSCRSDQAISYSISSYKNAKATQYYSMAHALLRAGIPCVVGMSHPISKAGAEIFAKRLYRVILSEGGTLARAVRQTRLELFAHSHDLLPSDWLSPVLYSRGKESLHSPLAYIPVRENMNVTA